MITKNKIVKIIELAKKCNECALHHFKKFDKKSVNYKDDNSPLTKADVEVNNIAVYGLQKLFPNIEIISEELYNSKHIFKNFIYSLLILFLGTILIVVLSILGIGVKKVLFISRCLSIK